MYETNTKSVNQKIQWEFCMMTKGDKRWIKNWKPKGVNMKPTKTKPAKRNDNPIIGKLLNKCIVNIIKKNIWFFYDTEI